MKDKVQNLENSFYFLTLSIFYLRFLQKCEEITSVISQKQNSNFCCTKRLLTTYEEINKVKKTKKERKNEKRKKNGNNNSSFIFLEKLNGIFLEIMGPATWWGQRELKKVARTHCAGDNKSRKLAPAQCALAQLQTTRTWTVNLYGGLSLI